MGRFLLVRHGESEANRLHVFASDDTPLTETGREQAREVAEKLAARFTPDLVVSSKFCRAEQTARIIAGRLGLSLEIVPALHERDFGWLIGKTYEAFGQLIANDPGYDAQHPWTWAPPEGETVEHVRDRVLEALEKLRAEHPTATIVVVCHGIVMQTLWAHLTGTWEGAEIPKNCAVIQVEHDESGFHLDVRECV